ncbi:MAG: ABC transporter ATP-binding protein [Bacteroidetes bacterium]|nr:ABC transporter ATP-binding protein [Bacteroidota bacterium]
MEPIDTNLIIETRKLDFAYNHQSVLRQIDLKVPHGSIFGFLGPNGAGKSTTIKALLGLLQVKSGMVYLFGKEFHANRIGLLQRTSAMVESPSLYEHLSATHNLEITQKLRQLSRDRIGVVLELVGLTKDSNKKVKQYSTGMKQRLSLAIALMSEPELLILDEPINGLDPSGIIEIRNLLTRLNKEANCTVFLSSHILDEIEKLCSHVAVINHGNLLFQGDISSFMLKYNQADSVILETGDNVQVSKMLLTDGAILEKDHVRVPFHSKQDIASMIRRINDAGIEIYAVERDRNDLESSFLEILTEGGNS